MWHCWSLLKGLVPFELVKNWYMWWLVTCLVPSHFLNQCWLIVPWTFWINSMRVHDINHLLPICDMWWLVAFLMPSHFMSQCRHIVQWTFLNKLHVRIWYEPFIAYVWHYQGLHWGLLSFKLVKFDTCGGLSPDRRHAIIWTTADLLFIETFEQTQALLCWNHHYCDH